MKILYLSLSYVPSRRASAVHVMKMCAALGRQGHEVELITKGCPARQEPNVSDDHAFYGVESNFTIRKLPRPDFRGGGLIYDLALERRLRQARREGMDLVYSRHLAGALRAVRLGLPTIFEAHGIPRGERASKPFRQLLTAPSFRRLVVISQALQDLLAEQDLLREKAEVLVAHDAADPIDLPSADQPSRSSSDEKRTQVGYVGHLYAGRGVDLILDMAESLESFDFHLVGGRPDDLAQWRARVKTSNVTFHGFVPPAELPTFYRRFDVLLMPYQKEVGVASGRSDTSRFMSPMKMFEYMAAGRAIVSSDLPVLREVLTDGRNARLVPPDDVSAWTQAVAELVSDRASARRLGDQALQDFESHYTWDARARTVLHGL